MAGDRGNRFTIRTDEPQREGLLAGDRHPQRRVRERAPHPAGGRQVGSRPGRALRPGRASGAERPRSADRAGALRVVQGRSARLARRAAIPLVDVRAQYAPLIPELERAFREVLESGASSSGRTSRRSSARPPTTSGVPEAIGVANGTDAIVLVLDALGIGPGDEVICPAFTFYATAEAIARRGATPVFADIDPRTLNLDPADVAERITPRTKAIVPVHLFGRPAPLETARRARPARDRGRRPGVRRRRRRRRTGVASTFSFFPTKNLFGLGDGGLVAATDEELAERVRLLRFHGSRDKQTFELVGTNSRLDEVQAAALRLFLPRLDGWNAQARREAAARYAELGLGELVELPADEPGHVYHMFCVPLARARPGARGPARAEIGHARLLRRRSTSSPPSPTSAGARARCRRPSAPPRRTSACRSGPGSTRTSSRSGWSRRARGAAGRRSKTYLTRHRVWQLGADAVAGRPRVVPGLPAALRLRGAAVLRDDAVGDDADRRRDQARRLRRLRLLPALVALRVHAGHVARGHRRHRRLRARGRPSTSATRSSGCGLPRGVALTDLLLLLAFVAGSRLAAARRSSSVPRAASCSRGKEVLVVAGRHGQLVLKELQKSRAWLHADRTRRRRPPQAQHAPARRACARLDRRPAAGEPRTAPTRCSSPSRPRRATCAAGWSRTARTTSRSGHAAGPVRAHRGRRRPRRPAPPRRGRGPARPRAVEVDLEAIAT